GCGPLFCLLCGAAIGFELALVRAGLALVGAQLLFIPLQLRAVALDLVGLRERRVAERDQCTDGEEYEFGFHCCPPREDSPNEKGPLALLCEAGPSVKNRRYFVSCLAAFFASLAAFLSALRFALSAFSFSLSALTASLLPAARSAFIL